MAGKVLKAAVGLGAASVVAVSGAALAASQTPAPSATSVASATSGQGQQGGLGLGGHGVRGPHQHSAASAAETAAVKNAVKAKDSSVTVTTVEKDADGSFDARGTKAGKPVHVDVSKDYQSVQVRTGFGGGHGHGGHGGPGERGDRGAHGRPMGQIVTGSDLTKVKAAVQAKASDVTVERAFKAPGGEFHAMGLKGGQPVHIEVSSDFKTVTVEAGRARAGHGEPGKPGTKAPSAGGQTSPSAGASAAPSAGTSSAPSSTASGSVAS